MSPPAFTELRLLPPLQGEGAQQSPWWKRWQKPTTDSYEGNLTTTCLCCGKQSFVCPESLSVNALQVIQLEGLLRDWLRVLYDKAEPSHFHHAIISTICYWDSAMQWHVYFKKCATEKDGINKVGLPKHDNMFQVINHLRKKLSSPLQDNKTVTSPCV